MPERTGDARALIDTAPSGHGSGHVRRCGWSVTLICETASGTRTQARRRAATAARLLDGIPASVRRYEGVVHHLMFHRVSPVWTVPSAMPLDLDIPGGQRLPGLGAALPAKCHAHPGPVRPAHDFQYVSRRCRGGDRPRHPGRDAAGVHAGGAQRPLVVARIDQTPPACGVPPSHPRCRLLAARIGSDRPVDDLRGMPGASAVRIQRDCL